MSELQQKFDELILEQHKLTNNSKKQHKHYSRKPPQSSLILILELRQLSGHSTPHISMMARHVSSAFVNRHSQTLLEMIYMM